MAGVFIRVNPWSSRSIFFPLFRIPSQPLNNFRVSTSDLLSAFRFQFSVFSFQFLWPALTQQRANDKTVA